MACILATVCRFELPSVARRIVRAMSVCKSMYRAVSDIPSMRENRTRTRSGILGNSDHTNPRRALLSSAAWSFAAFSAAIVESVYLWAGLKVWRGMDDELTWWIVAD